MQSGLDGVENFLLCTHCEGEGFCRANGEKGGCDFCRKEHMVARLEQSAGGQPGKVTCGACGGKGYFGTPPHPVSESKRDHHPRLGMLPVVISFITAGIVAMVASVFLVWAVQANAKNSIKYGNTDEAMRFDSYITVHENRRMTLEEIVILKNHQQKEFLVERVYPAFKGSFFERYKRDIRLKETYLDGDPVEAELSIKGKSFIIRAPEKMITPGVHTYAFVYDMPLPAVQSHGESVLNWVVSGNSWGFPAKQAILAVALPTNINRQSVELNGGVGPDFWFKRECISTMDDSGHITFTAGQPMTKLDRFAVRVVW